MSLIIHDEWQDSEAAKREAQVWIDFMEAVKVGPDDYKYVVVIRDGGGDDYES